MKLILSTLSIVLFIISAAPAHAAQQPSIVFIIADDLGLGDVSSYGQQKILTPNIQRLADGGMKFTTCYCGHNVCAPSRCVFMTGKHPGHAYIRENRQARGFDEGQVPVPADYLQLPLILKKQGYIIGGFGKWGLGPVGSSGDPLKQGFDRWFGYNCQAQAHNYYPDHLWDNDKLLKLDNPKFSAHQKMPAGADPVDPRSYLPYVGKEYAPDLIAEQAREFVRANKDHPFFLYFATTVPHLALQVPQDSLAEYAGKFPETPYTGDRNYLPQRQPHAAYAAMITRMDREVGRLLDLLTELKLDDNSIVIFTSDNGPLYDKLGGTDTEFFNSSAGLRGRKGSYYEGGIRVPCLVRWNGHIAAKSTCDRVCGFEDWLPTFLELIGATDATPADIDGISFAPSLFGQTQPPRPFLYRESPGYGGQQCIRVGEWKAIRRNLHPLPKEKDQHPTPIELYDLAHDPNETTDQAAKNPQMVRELGDLMQTQHVKSAEFPIRALDAQP